MGGEPKYVAFDIETTAVDNDNVDICNITVAVTETSDGDVKCWYTSACLDGDECQSCPCSATELNERACSYHASCKLRGVGDDYGAGDPIRFPMVAESRLSDDDCVKLFTYLEECVRAGYVISTWNGASFDFRVLAAMLRNAGKHDMEERCKLMARSVSHVDIMFSFFANKGFAVSLGKVAAAMLPSDVDGKSMDGKDAPAAWLKNGAMQLQVALYCAHDVTLQKLIHCATITSGKIEWFTRTGKRSKWNAKGEMSHASKLHELYAKTCLVGTKKRKRVLNKPTPLYASLSEFLSVEKSVGRPVPDNEWMRGVGMEPWERERFVGWLNL